MGIGVGSAMANITTGAAIAGAMVAGLGTAWPETRRDHRSDMKPFCSVWPVLRLKMEML